MEKKGTFDLYLKAKEEMKAKGSQGLRLNILLLFFSLVISIGIFEGALRYFTVFPIHGQGNLQPHRLLGYTLSPHLSDVDGEGFRNPPNISTEIVAIGDSHTQGYNVVSQDSWPSKLSSKIHKPIYNFGVGGYGVLHYGVLLANLPPNTKEIILGLYLANDFYFSNENTECITSLGKVSIERKFGVTVPFCEYKSNPTGIWTHLRGNSAIVSEIAYLIQDYQNKYILKKKKQEVPPSSQDDNISIDGIPVSREAINRYNLSTDRTNSKTAEGVNYFVALLKRFKELHSDIALKILIIPSKVSVLRSAEITCPRTAPSGVVLHEIDLKRYVVETLVSAGFQVEDALNYVLKQYCGSSLEEREAFYPPMNSHPLAEGYEAYAQAAYVLYNRI